MPKRGIRAVEAVGLVITTLAAQTVIGGLLDPDLELLWGIFTWTSGGRTGQMIFLGAIALVAALFGGWAHIRVTRAPGEPVVPGRSATATRSDAVRDEPRLLHDRSNTDSDHREEQAAPGARSGTGPLHGSAGRR